MGGSDEDGSRIFSSGDPTFSTREDVHKLKQGIPLVRGKTDLKHGKDMEESTVLKRDLPAAFSIPQPNGECILASALKASCPNLVTQQRANSTLEGNSGICKAPKHTVLIGGPNVAHT